MVRVVGWGALALAVAAGCGSSVTDGSGGAGGTGIGGQGASATGGVGGVGTGGEGGQPSSCPEALPIEGAPCEASPDCEYTVEGPCSPAMTMVTATCTPNPDGIALWQLDLADCNGDPAGCNDYDHPSVCAADTSCRWLVQGCGDPSEPTIEDGCHSAFDCAGPGDCTAGTTCTEVTIDPCHTFCPRCGACGACGSPAMLCL